MEKGKEDVGVSEDLEEMEGEEEELPEKRLKEGTEEGCVEEKVENDREEVADTREEKETFGLRKDEQRRNRKRRQSERMKNKKAQRVVSERVEGVREKDQIQEETQMTTEESLTLTESAVGMATTCDLSDSGYLSCEAGFYCPPAPIPLLYATQHHHQPQLQPAPTQPCGVKRPHSPLLSDTLPPPVPQPLQVRRKIISDCNSVFCSLTVKLFSCSTLC